MGSSSVRAGVEPCVCRSCDRPRQMFRPFGRAPDSAVATSGHRLCPTSRRCLRIGICFPHGGWRWKATLAEFARRAVAVGVPPIAVAAAGGKPSPGDAIQAGVSLIGAHVRRGDKINDSYNRYYTSKEYAAAIVEASGELGGAERQCVVFVASDSGAVLGEMQQLLNGTKSGRCTFRVVGSTCRVPIQQQPAECEETKAAGGDYCCHGGGSSVWLQFQAPDEVLHRLLRGFGLARVWALRVAMRPQPPRQPHIASNAARVANLDLCRAPAPLDRPLGPPLGWRLGLPLRRRSDSL